MVYSVVNCKVIKSGDVFNNVLVIEQVEDYVCTKTKNHVSRWLCECQQCHKRIVKIADNVKKNGCRYCTASGSRNYQWKGVGELHHESFNAIRNSAKRKSLEFNLTIDYLWELFLKQNRRCALSGVALILTNKWSTRTASLDRMGT